MNNCGIVFSLKNGYKIVKYLDEDYTQSGDGNYSIMNDKNEHKVSIKVVGRSAEIKGRDKNDAPYVVEALTYFGKMVSYNQGNMKQDLEELMKKAVNELRIEKY